MLCQESGSWGQSSLAPTLGFLALGFSFNASIRIEAPMKIKMLLGLGGGLLGWRFFFIYPSLTDSNPSLVGEMDPGILVGDIEPDF